MSAGPCSKLTAVGRLSMSLDTAWDLLLSPPLLAALHGAEMGQSKALVLTDVLLKSVLYYFLCQSFAVSAFFNTLGNWA